MTNTQNRVPLPAQCSFPPDLGWDKLEKGPSLLGWIGFFLLMFAVNAVDFWNKKILRKQGLGRDFPHD